MRVAPIADKARKCNSLFDTDGEDGMGRKEKKKKKSLQALVAGSEPGNPHPILFVTPSIKFLPRTKAESGSKGPSSLQG